jgi:putative membrane protein
MYAARASGWSVEPLADQGLAGLIMWVGSGAAFAVFGLALFAAWLGEARARVRR